MRIVTEILIELDPVLSLAIARDEDAGLDFNHVLRDVQQVCEAAIVRGEPLLRHAQAAAIKKLYG